MTLPAITTRSLTVPGTRLHYEVRGHTDFAAHRGERPLLVIGSPMASAEFASLADALAGERTVVTYDPRGIAKSTIEDPQQDSTPQLRADDVAAILDDLGAESADVFGSSGGAVTGLALIARHPQRVGTLVAHEPPLLALLPDADLQRANTQDIIDTYGTDGMHAAWFKFMVNAGFDVSAMSAPEGAPVQAPPKPSADELREADRFFNHELWHTTQYLPDISALTAGPSRVVVGIGVDSGHLLTYRTSTALAELLGSEPVDFPGDHGGFMGAPEEFARRLVEVLA